MKRLTVTCANDARYEGDIDDTDTVEINGHGEISIGQDGNDPVVIRLPSPAIKLDLQETT